jgi:fatty-acyl-CoA synthase
VTQAPADNGAAMPGRSAAAGGDTPIRAWNRALTLTARIGREPFRTLPILIERLAETHGDAPALFSEDDRASYRGLAARANRYARWALARSLKAGDVVCLMMPNCVDYFAIWLGLTRVGITVALLNTNLRGASLAHSIDLVAPRLAIVDGDFDDAFAAARSSPSPGLECWAYGRTRRLPRIDHAVRGLSGEPLDAARSPPPSLAQRALLLYTSGTTGLPKAANVSHFRLLQWSCWAAGMMDTRADDRMYDCLPMYHSIGGVVAIGALLVNGGSVVLRRKFSAGQFWDDVADSECTLFQYVGELCRYLVNSPPQPRETQHRIRLCCGNGLRAEVWTALQRRFRIPRVLEFYAATEGSFALYNCEGKPGAIGRVPPFLAHRFPMALVRFDVATGEPTRGPDGFCIGCATNEVGEALGRLRADGAVPGGAFEGYTDAAASRSKVLRDVFANGDAWLRTGDLMRRDASGYVYFVDRVGDSFRWKGENVSTTEVAEAIAGCSGVVEAAVYGAAVPFTEGRAGMAAIVVAADFELAALHRQLVDRLPEYARPLFLRLCHAIQTTGSLKQNKRELIHAGYDPAGSTDPVYFNDRARGSFVRLDAGLYRRLQDGSLRL